MGSNRRRPTAMSHEPPSPSSEALAARPLLAGRTRLIEAGAYDQARGLARECVYYAECLRAHGHGDLAARAHRLLDALGEHAEEPA